MASTHRVNRVRQMLLREFSDIVGRLKDPRIGMVTVVGTEVSRDLKYATMSVSILGDEHQRQESIQALEQALGFIRYQVAQRVRLRQVPEIRLQYDTSFEQAAKVTELIEGLHRGEDG